ncbi:hypothetical protein PTSG_08916 [Salpingoeca rosetta]|uniref:Proteasome activator complex subunit 4 C-terminal domain-containing protein n=1 Tax=Salpingoeca rosetta (strain ATCC 50818 / BSB-021) TaxID=946362 RepID=F2UL26_SALR5|nr:uncharacterized protein PTSG_08916 [Salpingoeca rosetta]EGD77825.1 hypothetical protein PTSG_08916 [Salpingoeca rosetta]|eukprot:XP_004990301.1 hypothetical protein PTSG_08916 [Salpingoeca rosetta]
MLSPRRFVPWVVDQMYSGLESLESHRLIATLLLLSGIPKFLFSPTFVPNGDAHLIPLLHALLPALDVNDPNKSLEAMNVLMEVTQTVTFVDCSNAIPDDASAEEQEAMEATCQIESWLDAFLDTMFELVENMSGLSTPAGWRNASLSFDAMLQGAFMQLSPELANRAVDKTATWLLTRAVNRSNGSIKAVARSAAICNPKRMLDKVLPTLTEKLLDLCAHEATIDEAKREVMGRMTLLVSYLDVWRSIITQLDPAVMEHKDSIMAVFRAVLRLRGQGAVQRAADTLGVLLERLTLPWMPDRSAVTVDDRQGKTDIDPVTMFRRRFYSGMSEDEVTESIFTYKFLKPLVDGTLDPRWRKPTAETRAFAEELVAAFYDDAVAFLRECTTKTSKEAAATVDRDMLRTALSIVECVADTPTVVWPFTADKFDAQEGGIPGAPFKTQPPRHWVEPTCERAHERRGELIEVLTALVPWAMEHRASDVKVLKACVICAQVTLVPSTRAQSRIAGAVGHVGETSTALSRAYLMGMLEELDAARYDMDLVVQPLLATDVPLVQAIVETLRSPLPDVRFVAEHVLLQISDLCWNRGVPLIFDMLLELWDQVRTDPVDDAKHALMGVLALLSTPTMSGWTAQDSGRLLRVYRLLRQCTHFEDQELYDQLNAFAATQCSNLPGFPWPVPHSPSCLQAAHRLPTTARRQNNDKTSKSEAAETEQQQQQEGAGEGRMDTAQDEGGASASGVDAYGRPRRRQSIVQWRREQSHSTQEVMLLALDALKAPDLTWKHKLWFASVAGFLASATETLHPEVVGFLFRNLVSDEPALREGCQVAMVRVLQALKTPVAKVDVRVTQDGDVVEVNGPYCWRRVASIDQPFRGDLADLQQRDQDPSCGGGTGGDGGGGGDGGDGAGNTTPAHQDQQQQQQSSSWSYKHQHFGYRKDTRVVCPKIDPATMQVQDIGEDEVYFDKPFWGWYAWPSVVRTYAPEKYQSFDHFIGRHPAPTEKDTRVGEDGAPVSPCMDVEHMLAASRAVIELELQDPAFLHRLIGFLKEDTFTSLRRVSHLFKGLFRNYGYALVPLVLPDVATLCQSTLRQDHRAAAGVLLGLLRGSKHWPRADKVKMRAEVEPLLEGTLLTMPASVMRAWTALVQLTVCEHDPRRSAWLMNLLLRKYFEPDPTRTALQKNVLGSALSAVLGELSWRARHISRLVMEKAAADVPHAYGLVRQTAVGLIVCGYTALVPTKNPLCTTEATTVTAAAGGVKGGAQGKEASEGGVEDQASSAKGDQADAETEAEIDADEEAQFLAAFTASLMAPLRAAVETTPTTPAAHLGEGKFDVLSEIGVPGEKRAVEAANARGDMATKRAALIAMDTEADGGVADSDAVAVDTRAHRHHRFHHGGPREQHTHRPRPHPHPSSGQPVSPPPGTGEGGEGVVLSVPENVSFEEFQQLMQQQLAQLKIPSDQAQQMMRQMHEQVTRLHHQQQQQQQQQQGLSSPSPPPSSVPQRLRPPPTLVQQQQQQQQGGGASGMSTTTASAAASGGGSRSISPASGGGGDDTLPEDEKRRLKAVCHLIGHASRFSSQQEIMVLFLEHAEVLLDLLERVSDKDLSRSCKVSLRRMVAHSTVESGRRLCNYLQVGACTWHTKALVLSLLTTVARNTFPHVDPCVTETTMSHLEDPQVEVQQAASQCVTLLTRMGVLRGIPSLLQEFMSRAEAKVRRVKRAPVVSSTPLGPEHQPLSAEEKATLRRKHSGVLGVSALINAHPYDMPSWMPKALLLLAAHTTDVNPIKSTANKALTQFWKTHKEAWHEMKNQLTAEEQTTLQDVLISPSYYA